MQFNNNDENEWEYEQNAPGAVNFEWDSDRNANCSALQIVHGEEARERETEIEFDLTNFENPDYEFDKIKSFLHGQGIQYYQHIKFICPFYHAVEKFRNENDVKLTNTVTEKQKHMFVVQVHTQLGEIDIETQDSQVPSYFDSYLGHKKAYELKKIQQIPMDALLDDIMRIYDFCIDMCPEVRKLVYKTRPDFMPENFLRFVKHPKILSLQECQFILAKNSTVYINYKKRVLSIVMTPVYREFCLRFLKAFSYYSIWKFSASVEIHYLPQEDDGTLQLLKKLSNIRHLSIIDQNKQMYEPLSLKSILPIIFKSKNLFSLQLSTQLRRNSLNITLSEEQAQYLQLMIIQKFKNLFKLMIHLPCSLSKNNQRFIALSNRYSERIRYLYILHAMKKSVIWRKFRREIFWEIGTDFLFSKTSAPYEQQYKWTKQSLLAQQLELDPQHLQRQQQQQQQQQQQMDIFYLFDLFGDF